MKQTIAVTIFCIFLGIGFCGNVPELVNGCTKIEEPQIFPVHYGWPYKIQCSLIFEINGARDLLESLYDYYYEEENEENIWCLISNSRGRSLLNVTTTINKLHYNDAYYHLPDVRNETDLNYFITIKLLQSKKCSTFSIKLNVSQLQNVSCQDFVRQELQSKRKFSSDVGGRKQFSCSTALDQHPGLYLDYDAPNTTIQWQRNCSDLPSGATVNENNQMTIPSLTFDHAGVYVCSVTHNGMTRYVLVNDVCLSHPATINKPTISCAQDHYHGKIGGDLTMRCTLTMGDGNFDSIRPHISITWHKSNQTSKFEWCKKKSLMHSFKKSTCFYTTEGSRDCIRHIATQEERSASKYLIHITIKILNLQPQDFTTYSLRVVTYYEETVEARIDVTELAGSSHVLAITLISIGIAIVILMLVIFIYKNRSKRLLF